MVRQKIQIESYGPFSVLFAVLLLPPGLVAEGAAGDCAAVRQLYKGSAASTNRAGDTCCDWAGVNCSSSGSTPTVKALQLNSSHLHGSLPPALFSLTSLAYLDLSDNNLSEPVPEELRLLKNLKHLDLSWNNFSGDIPSSIWGSNCSHLQVFNLEHNRVAGNISGDVSKCHSLEEFLVGNNELSGQVPSELLSISSLTNLSVAGNQLEGSLPPFGSLSSLVSLDMSKNQLNGSVVLGGQITSIQFLDLSSNHFSSFRVEQGVCWSLSMLNLSGNQISKWDFLDNMANCGNLKQLDLSNNDCRSPFPSFPGRLSTQLVSLRLRGNAISEGGGGIPSGYLPNLEILDMGNTSLSGTIPAYMNSFTNLKELTLDHNNLTGGLSETLAYLHNLQVLDISHNNFAGPMTINTSRSVASLRLSWNEFNGTLPQELGVYLPNLTTLDASYNDLSGEIPNSLENCTHLASVDLKHNNLSGHIPVFFSQMETLKLLDLSSNDLGGPLPTGGIFDDPSSFRVGGNWKLCQDNQGSLSRVLEFCHGNPPTGSGEGIPTGRGANIPTGKSRSGLPKAALAAIVVVVVFLLSLLVFLFIYKRKCFAYKNLGAFVEEVSFLKSPLRVTPSDLQTATRGFSSTCLIGSGGIGSVYIGFLEREKKEVAVKVLQQVTSGDSRSFLEACSSIRMFAHRNLVKMVASCRNVDAEGNQFQALVYEFTPYGNLEMWLHEEVVSQAMSFKKWNLNLYQRLGIAIDVASVLSYLHCNFEPPVVHCNLKPSNILIADDMTAHVTDLGMSKLFDVDMIVRKSAGYMAPELSAIIPMSPKWDVYSFGVILLEIFTGKRPTDEESGGAFSLQRYVLQCCPSKVEEIVDPLLLSEETGGKLTDRSRECIISILNIALSCSKESPGERMPIIEAHEKLERAKAALLDAGGDGDVPRTTYDRDTYSANKVD